MSEQMAGMLLVSVTDRQGEVHQFVSTGPHETYDFRVNDYTNELMVDRIEWGPRGEDEWARISAVVVAAWPSDLWSSASRHNG